MDKCESCRLRQILCSLCTNKEEFSKADRIELVPVAVRMAERGAGKAAFEQAKYTAKLNYRQGEWDMFDSITSVWYGKQCYFREDNGMVYSRVSGRHMPRDEAIKEFLDKIDE